MNARKFQGGLSNEELAAAFAKKLPGVTPTDRELSAFALGIEVGESLCHEAEQAFHRPTWKAALTLAHNLCAQYSNRHNDNDETEQADALNEMCGHIKPYLDCTDEEIAEMVAEANPSRYVNSSDSSGDPQR